MGKSIVGFLMKFGVKSSHCVYLRKEWSKSCRRSEWLLHKVDCHCQINAKSLVDEVVGIWEKSTF